MAIPVDDLTAALPTPATAPPAPAAVPDPPVTTRVPVAVPPTAPVEPVTALVPLAVPPTVPVEPATALVPVAVPPTAPVEPVTTRCRWRPATVPVEPVTARVATVPPAAPAVPVPAAAPAPVPVAEALAEVLAEVLGVEQVSVDAHFFDDLGADSMVMAQFCARVRKRADLPSVSMKDIYQHPTYHLATALCRSAVLRAVRRDRHGRPLLSTRRSPRCWPGFWVSSRCRSMRTSSMIWVPTRW